MCGLEVAKAKVADLGNSIEAVLMIRKTYVDDGSWGGAKETVDRLFGEKVADKNGNLSYTGTVSKYLPWETLLSLSWSGMGRPGLTLLTSWEVKSWALPKTPLLTLSRCTWLSLCL